MQPREAIIGVPGTSVTNVPNPGEIAAGSEATFDVPLPQDGYITRLYARAYKGHEADVEYHADLIPNGQGDSNTGSPINLVGEASSNSVQFLAGNDQTWDWRMREGFSDNDVIRFTYDNTDTNNPHLVDMYFIVDYDVATIEQLNGVGF